LALWQKYLNPSLALPPTDLELSTCTDFKNTRDQQQHVDKLSSTILKEKRQKPLAFAIIGPQLQEV
jgi:hypothetical protein